MDNEKKIEIPFGAFDSELEHQEINIPNGFKAVIDGNKIILTRAEREDEKVRKALAEMVHDTTGDSFWVDYNVHKEEALAWLEKQGESYTKRDVDDAYIEGMACAKNELEKQSEQKSTWSEEDEKMIRGLIVICDEWTTRHSFYPIENCEIEKLKNWLESLKERY